MKEKNRNKKTVGLVITLVISMIVLLVLVNRLSSRIASGNKGPGKSSAYEIVKKPGSILNKLKGEVYKKVNEKLALPANLPRDPFALSKEMSQFVTIPSETNSEDSAGAAKAEEKDPVADLALKAIMTDGDEKICLINSQTLKVNGEIAGFRIVSIENEEVKVKKNENVYTLSMKGGEIK